jgi:hypothetical protein
MTYFIWLQEAAAVLVGARPSRSGTQGLCRGHLVFEEGEGRGALLRRSNAAINRIPSFNIGLGTKDLATRMSVGRVVSIPVGRRERTHMAIAGPTRFWHFAADSRERAVIKIVLGALQVKCPPRARRWVVRRRPPVPTRLLPVEMMAAEGRQASI